MGITTKEALENFIRSASPHVAKNSGNNEWYTPPEFIDSAKKVMGGIDLDPASSDKANEIIGAKHYYTKEDDGLATKNMWSGRVWMNPPYSRDLIGRFCEKYYYSVVLGQIEQGIVLVNNATETRWFKDIALVSHAVVFTRGRISFLDPSGNPIGKPLQGQALLYHGPNFHEFINEFTKFGWGALVWKG